MCMAKAASYLALTKLYPEYRYAFIGDSGQADAMFASAVTKGTTDRCVRCPTRVWLSDRHIVIPSVFLSRLSTVVVVRLRHGHHTGIAITSLR